MATENEMEPTEMSPTEEMIAARAYERYVQRGREDGKHLEDWLAAEGQLRAELVAQASGEGTSGQRTPRTLTTQPAAIAARS